MDILIQLTDTNLIVNLFCCGTEPPTLPAGFTTPVSYPLDTYIGEPEDNVLVPTHFIIRKLTEPRGVWPPIAAYPYNKITFINSATIPFQTENEGGEET